MWGIFCRIFGRRKLVPMGKLAIVMLFIAGLGFRQVSIGVTVVFLRCRAEAIWEGIDTCRKHSQRLCCNSNFPYN